MEATAEQVRQLRLEAEAAVEAVRGAAAAEAAAWEAEARELQAEHQEQLGGLQKELRALREAADQRLQASVL